MLSFFQKQAREIASYPYVNFQKVFQLYSSYYRQFDPNSLPEDSHENPLALIKGISEGVCPDLYDALTDPLTKIDEIYYLKNPNEDWIVYGQYSMADPKKKEAPHQRLFMMMFGANHVQNDDELDTYYIPYFTFDAIIASSQNEALLIPLNVSTVLEADKNELQFNEYEFPKEFGMAICFADAVFCQILANQKVDVAENQKWVEEYPDVVRKGKIAFIQSRSFDLLKAQVEEYADNRNNGITPQPS